MTDNGSSGLGDYSPGRSHHAPGGGYRNPWPMAYAQEPGGVFRWQRERRAANLAPNPPPEAFPRVEAEVVALPAPDRLRITWVGHSTFLVQIAGLNILTDPQWSQRASPVSFAGPRRLTPPGIEWDRLPPIDAILISHDHFDHLDSATVRRLHRRFGAQLRWFTPLGYRSWFGSRGITRLDEFDWWRGTTLQTAAGALNVVCLPSQHWTSRTPWGRSSRLWGSWALTAPNGRSVYFGGDSGYFPGYPEIGERFGPFSAALLPIGAYEPRWFMRPAHMNPAEAVTAYLELGGRGAMLGMHWGTWRLTDEDPLEPPIHAREVWSEANLPPENLVILPHGGSWEPGY